MKPVNQILLSGLVGTSAMTLFSYMASKYEKENFKEPELLADFIDNSFKTGPVAAKPLGWGTHYTIGVGWAVFYKFVLKGCQTKPSLKNGVLFGAFAGVTGALAWNMLFKKHSRPPHTNRRKFYIQLLLAHLVYGAASSACIKRK